MTRTNMTLLVSLAGAAISALGCDGSLDPDLPAGDVQVLTGALVTPGTVLIDARFDSNADGFSYQDDTFRNSSQPAYASGTRVSSGGFTGGALRVRLGGIDDNDITDGMSGGWRRTFTLTESAKITLTFRYNLIQTPDYEADELSQIHATLDGVPLGVSPGTDHFVTITGDGEGGPPRAVGWHLQTNNLGVLGAGTHTLVFGGFNNQKSSATESTDAFIDDVRVVADPPPGTQIVLDATFDSNAQGFTYQDDLFRGTDEPAYAAGAFSATGGFQGGGLTVTLGGRDEADVTDGMSGGWSKTFNLPVAAQVSLSFRYNLEQTPDYEADEFSQNHRQPRRRPVRRAARHRPLRRHLRRRRERPTPRGRLAPPHREPRHARRRRPRPPLRRLQQPEDLRQRIHHRLPRRHPGHRHGRRLTGATSSAGPWRHQLRARLVGMIVGTSWRRFRR